jgi:hypothetical protein
MQVGLVCDAYEGIYGGELTGSRAIPVSTEVVDPGNAV